MLMNQYSSIKHIFSFLKLHNQIAEINKYNRIIVNRDSSKIERYTKRNKREAFSIQLEGINTLQLQEEIAIISENTRETYIISS